jgi:tetratricopeptide (TPR) repeat protein
MNIPRLLPTAFLALGLAVLTAASCTPGNSEEGALIRGDEAFARGDVTEALAEYRLALRHAGDDVAVLTRAAHAFARAGRIDEARDLYMSAVARDPDVADLAASDLLRVAKRATERRDGTAAAAAVEAALQVKPGVSITGLALPLARHFTMLGQHSRALPYFQMALQEGESDPQVLFEMALTHSELGDCRRAVVFLEQVRPRVGTTRRSEVDWHMGNCSYELGMEALMAGDRGEALELFQATIRVGQPRARLGQAWYEVGEILAAQGRCDEAVDALQRVQREDLSGGALVQRAQERVDQIRFRRAGDGPC